VKIVAVGGGLAYGSLGYSHHSVEDLAVLLSLPHLTVTAPGDPAEAQATARALVARPGPAYLRLGKAGEPAIHTRLEGFVLGKAITMQPGSDLTLISTGGMLGTTVAAAKELAAKEVSARVLSMHTLSPLDVEAIIKAAKETHAILTVEEHGVGGLGTKVAEVLAGLVEKVHFKPLRLEPEPIKHAGTQAVLRSEQDLSVTGIVAAALACGMRKA
jgi:transketolase